MTARDRRPSTPRARISVSQEQGKARIRLAGALDAYSIGEPWAAARAALSRFATVPIIVDASGVEYCDGAGIAMLVDLLRQPRTDGAKVEIQDLRPEYRALLDEFDPTEFRPQRTAPQRREAFTERVGRATVQVGGNLYQAVAFIGEILAALASALSNPRSIRWTDMLLVCRRVGADALGIVSLIGFLLGVILAFQSAVFMRKFGAELLVADLLGASLLRELGALITAILLAGRSGAAFAAEIGTMKVNEELDALTTMSLDPVRFLVVPRVLAALVMTPLLTLYANLIGLFGGALVLLSFDISFTAYFRELFRFVSMSDFVGGMAKPFVFGLIVAAVGCLRGLQTGRGAAAVGLSATSAVVTAIVLIVVADGIFAVVYYHLGI